MTPRPVRPRTAAACFVVAVLFAAPALAAETKERPGRFQVGPFWFTPKIELRSAGRNSNVYNQENSGISDAAAVLSPSLELGLPVGRRSRFASEGFLNLNWFREQASERSTDRGFTVRGESDLGPVTVFGETGRGWYKQRFTIDLDERLLYRERAASAGAAVKLGSKLTATGSVEARRFEIDAPADVPSLAASLDRDTRTLRVEARYALTRRTGLLVSNEWIRDQFDETIGVASREVNSKRLLAGFDFSSQALSGRFLAGVRAYPAERDSAAPSYQGPALSASLAFPVSNQARLKLEAEREVYYASRPGLLGDGTLARNSYVSWRSRAELSLELPFDLLARPLLGLEDASYQLPYEAAALPFDASSHRWTYGGTLLRVFSKGFKIGGGITWERRSGRAPTNPYRGASWGLQAEYTP